MMKKWLVLAVVMLFAGIGMVSAESKEVPYDEELTEIIFIIDRSGSMSGLEKETIGGYNGFVEAQTKLGRTQITTILFDNQYEVVHSGVEASKAKLTDKEYYVRGTTALYDAVGKTINDVNRRIGETPRDQRPKRVFLVITTDGYENASREFTKEKVAQLLEIQQKEHKWEVVFFGANINSSEVGGSLNVPASNTKDFKASPEGSLQMYDGANELIKGFRLKQ